MKWVEALDANEYRNDIIIVAGDITDDIAKLTTTLKIFVSKFKMVFAVPGNHDLWVESKRKSDGASDNTHEYSSSSHSAYEDTSESAKGSTDSVSKLYEFLELCESIGVKTRPEFVLGEMWIVPLLSWYYYNPSSYINDRSVLKLGNLRLWQDFTRCVWPESILSQPSHDVGVITSATSSSTTTATFTIDQDALHATIEKQEEITWGHIHPFLRTSSAKLIDITKKLALSKDISRYMMELNEESISKMETFHGIHGHKYPIITFSHFLPRAELNPPMDQLKFKELVCVSVSEELDTLIRRLHSTCHVYGHTHIRSDKQINGVRYIQYPLGYPSEPWCKTRDIKDFEIKL